MKTPKIEAHKCIASAATCKADELSLRLFNLTEIVKLAAFAAESRRVLRDIKNAALYRPEMQKVIDDSSERPHTWMEMDDVTGNVLDYLSRQLEEVNNGFLSAVHDLANGGNHGAYPNRGAAGHEAGPKGGN